jgi:hypothetical protein
VSFSFGAGIPPGTLPEVRRLTEQELEELHHAKKTLQERLSWRKSNSSDTIREASCGMSVDNLSELSFRVQSVMDLTLKVVLPIRPKRLDFFYRVRATKQIVRMYHSDPGHDAVDGRIDGPHKHRFPERWDKRAYSVDDIPAAVNQAVLGFFKEESIKDPFGAEKFGATSKLMEGD